MVCKKCNIDKDELMFPWRIKDIKRNVVCKKCQNIYKTAYYNRNKEKVKAISRKCNIIRVDKCKEYINTLKSKGCLTCQESDYCCLDFHHLKLESKLYNISELASAGFLDKVIEECKKCIVICSNCHRKLHAGRININGLLSTVDDFTLNEVFEGSTPSQFTN